MTDALPIDDGSAHPDSAPRHRSRRALLAGALGGLGAWAAAAAAKVNPVHAAAGSPLILGSQANNAGSSDTQLLTNSSVIAFKLLQNGPGTALMGYATPVTGATRGVYGRTDSPHGDGIQARNSAGAGSGTAVRAIGGINPGIIATADTNDAVRGYTTDGIGVFGRSTTFDGVRGVSTDGKGVRGISTDEDGLYGISTNGAGVHGESAVTYGGFFVGGIRTTKQIDVAEMTTPGSAAPDTARLFVRDNGGKTELCVIFQTGVVQVIAAEV